MAGYFPLTSLAGLYPKFTLGAVTPGFRRGGPIAAPAGSTVSTGGLTPAAPTEYNPAVGGKPVVPDPLTAAKQAIAAAMANLPTAIAGANQINAANQAAALKQITDLYPQFGANTAQLGADVGSWARGEVSPSTMAMLQQGAAERNIASGFGAGSPASNAAYLRLLGLTSEELQQRALTGQNTLLAGIPRTALTDPTRLMPSADTLTSDLYNAQLMANIYASAPNPSDAYNLALFNARGGLTAGGRAGYTPPAAAPSGGIDPSTQALLDMLVNRVKPLDTGRSYQDPNAPAPTTDTTGGASAMYIPGYGARTSEDYDMNYLMTGADPLGIYGSDMNAASPLPYNPFGEMPTQYESGGEFDFPYVNTEG